MSELAKEFGVYLPPWGGYAFGMPRGDSRAFLKRGYEVTTLDASGTMAELASRHIGRRVLRMSFDQVRFRERFDGVWASASLLHVPRQSTAKVLERLVVAL
jgi:hypothetical protein